MIDQQILQYRWQEIRGKLKQRWGQLTDDDLKTFEGDVDQLAGLIQRKTGESREAITSYLEQISASSPTTAETASRFAETPQPGSQAMPQGMPQQFDDISQRVRSGYLQGEQLIQRRPIETVAVAFGVGLTAGVLFGLIGRSRRPH